MYLAYLNARSDGTGSDQRRHRPQRAALLLGHLLQIGIEISQAIGVGQIRCLAPQLLPGGSHIFDVQGRHVQRLGHQTGGAFQGVEQLLDRGDIGILRQQPVAPELETRACR